jgi:hypothetical protein
MLIVSCGKKAKDAQDQIQELIETNPIISLPSDEEQSDNEVVTQGPDIKVDATLMNFNEERETKMKKAIKLLKQVVNGMKFKKRILEHKYGGDYRFVDNDGLTNQEIYDTVVKGSEEQLVGNNSTIDLIVHLYYTSNNVVGYTYPSKLDIYVNRKYFDPNSLSKIAANLMHEWMHKLGFGHSYYYNSARPYSVPYAVGSIIKELGSEIEDTI